MTKITEENSLRQKDSFSAHCFKGFGSIMVGKVQLLQERVIGAEQEAKNGQNLYKPVPI